MFMGDTFASARTFSTAGTWTMKTVANGDESRTELLPTALDR